MRDVVWMSNEDTHFIWESDTFSFDMCRSDPVLSGNGSVMTTDIGKRGKLEVDLRDSLPMRSSS